MKWNVKDEMSFFGCLWKLSELMEYKSEGLCRHETKWECIYKTSLKQWEPKIY